MKSLRRACEGLSEEFVKSLQDEVSWECLGSAL